MHLRKRALASEFRKSSSGLGRSSASSSLGERGCFSLGLLVQRKMNLASSFAQLHQSAVADNRRQPGGDLRLPPKLVYVSVSC